LQQLSKQRQENELPDLVSKRASPVKCKLEFLEQEAQAKDVVRRNNLAAQFDSPKRAKTQETVFLKRSSKTRNILQQQKEMNKTVLGRLLASSKQQ